MTMLKTLRLIILVFVIGFLPQTAIGAGDTTKEQKLTLEDTVNFLFLQEFCRGFNPAFDEGYQQTIHVTQKPIEILESQATYSKQQASLEALVLKDLPNKDLHKECLHSFTTGIFEGYLQGNLCGNLALRKGLSKEGYKFIRQKDFVTATINLANSFKLPLSEIERITKYPAPAVNFDPTVAAPTDR